MTCYQCSHCNKCGIFSMKLELVCNTCGADVIAGKDICPECGTPYFGNTTRGKMGKPKEANDYYTKLEESMGLDAHRTTDMSKR